MTPKPCPDCGASVVVAKVLDPVELRWLGDSVTLDAERSLHGHYRLMSMTDPTVAEAPDWPAPGLYRLHAGGCRGPSR